MKKTKSKNTNKEEAHKLYRSKQDKVIAGVCGGIAEHFKIDPVWVRLAAVLLVLADGIGLILYILAWILVPQNPSQTETSKTKAEKIVEKIKTGKIHKEVLKKGHSLFGLIIVLIGTGLLMKNIFSWFSFNYTWPIILIAIGLTFLMRSK